MQVDYKGSVSPGKPHIGIRVLPGKQPGREVLLRPGCNTVEDAAWSEVKDHPSVVRMTANGELAELKGEKGAAFDITKLSPMAALDLITRSTEPATLERWRKQLDAAGGPSWKAALEKLDKQITAVTTDALGQPAKQRPLRLLPA